MSENAQLLVKSETSHEINAGRVLKFSIDLQMYRQGGMGVSHIGIDTSNLKMAAAQNTQRRA